GKNDILFATVGGNDGPNLDQFDLTLVKEIAPLYVSNNFVQKSVKIFVHSGKLILEGVNGQNANDEVLIYDMDGKMVLKSEKTPVVNLKMLPKGVYFAKISGQNKSFIMKIPVF
ncbi:MAG: T9SS type A sorting domain-containing protein, partial [Fibrobacteraceae bacterium]|nr:T9SS type A sorting domain-containing protein [Fibrobacteraceae bacterium]